MNKFQDLIKKIELAKLEDVKARAEEKKHLDDIFSLSIQVDNGKLTVRSGQISDTGDIELIAEGAVVDPIGLRFVIQKGSVKDMLDRALASGIHLLEVNIDHDSQSIGTGNVGYVDLSKARLEPKGNGRVSLVAPVSLDSARPIIQDIARQQELGTKFGVSIEIADTNFESETVDIDNESIYTIKKFDILNLAIVRNGANVGSNFNLFNLNTMATKETKIKLEAETNVVETQTVPVATPEVVENEAVVETETTVEATPEAVDETIQAVEKIQAENEAINEENAKLRAELSERNAQLNDVDSRLTRLQGIVKVKEIPTTPIVERKLAATVVTPYSGTNYNNPMDDPSLYRSTVDPIVQELRANDDDRFYPLQPRDATAGDYTPVVRASEFNGWNLGAFDPLTQCCWKLELTGEAFATEYLMGTACMQIDVNQWDNLYMGHGQGLQIKGQEGLTPFQKRQIQTVRVLAERANYGILQGNPLAPASAVPAWDGLVSLGALAPMPISASNGILGAMDLWITRMNAWFPSEVSPDGTGLVAYMHDVTKQKIKEEARMKMVQGVTSLNLADKDKVDNYNMNGYRGITFTSSPRYIIDNSNGVTAGQTNIIITPKGNIAAKLFYMSMGKNGVEFADAQTASPIQIGSNVLSAIPGCQLSSTWVYFVAGLAYAKNRLQIGLITDVQTLTGSEMSGFRDTLGIHLSGKITLN